MEKKVYSGQIIQVTEEKIGTINWERVYLPNGLVIFPITSESRILMIEEKRPHEKPNRRLKPVTGIIELDKGDLIENAQREMQEEIGLRAKKMTPFWTSKSTGTVNNEQHFFLAEDLFESKLPNPDGEDSILSVQSFSLEELMNLYQTNQIEWSHSTLGFFKLYNLLKSRYP